jgi:hypothetical protein
MGKKLTVLIAFFISLKANAQNHYWLQQFGSENTLLGGAVIGGVDDNSALYYNPARLGFITAAKISVSANAYGIDKINLKNAAGNGLDLNSSKLLLYPQIASGSINIKKTDRLKFVYGTLVRYRALLHFEQANSRNYDVFTQLPGEEFYDARVDFDYNSISNWIGGGLGYRISDHWSIGYTQFFTYTNIQYHQGNDITSDNKIGPYYFVSSNNHALNFNINNANAIEKIGIAYETRGKKDTNFYFKIGLTGTMPSLKIYSRSKASQTLELNNLEEQYFSVDSFLTSATVINSSQNKMKSILKDPGSIAFGFEFSNARFRFCASMEYFFRVKEYTMIQDNTQTVIRPVKNNNPNYVSNYITVREAKSAVINGAIGFEYRFKPKEAGTDKEHQWSILGGIRTDFNNKQLYRLVTVVPGAEQAYNPDNWGYIHYSAGVAIDKKSNKFSFGIDYGRGLTTKSDQAINIEAPAKGHYLLGTKQHTVIPKVSSINIVIGYTYRFNKRDKLMNMKPIG